MAHNLKGTFVAFTRRLHSMALALLLTLCGRAQSLITQSKNWKPTASLKEPEIASEILIKI